MKPPSHADTLRQTLARIDRRGYKAYKAIKGTYRFDRFTLIVDHVQGDPFAAPTRVRVRVEAGTHRLPAELLGSAVRRTAACDFLARAFSVAAGRVAKGSRGTGKSGLIAIDTPGQEVLRRTCVLVVDEGAVEARFVMGLPASGRTVLARQAETMFFEEVPAIVAGALFAENLDIDAMTAHVEVVEDQQAMRDRLRDRGLVAFVGDGAVLPRASGIDDRPLASGRIVPFVAPDALAVTRAAP